MLGVPTILFEAGHYRNDYDRERTREYIFYALVEGIRTIAENRINTYTTDAYFGIPENQKLFYDILILNTQEINSELTDPTSIGVRYKEVLENNSIFFVPEIADLGNLDGYFGHQELDCMNKNDLNLVKNQKEVLDLILDVRK